MATNLKAVDRNDLGAMVTGTLAVILTTFGSYITISTSPPLPPTVDPNGYSAWDGVGGLASLLLVLGVIVVAVRIFGPDLLTPKVPWHYLVAGAAGLGTLMLLIKGLTFGVDGPQVVQDNVDVGIGWSGWAVIALGIAFAVFAYLGSGSTSYAAATAEDD